MDNDGNYDFLSDGFTVPFTPWFKYPWDVDQPAHLGVVGESGHRGILYHCCFIWEGMLYDGRCTVKFFGICQEL